MSIKNKDEITRQQKLSIAAKKAWATRRAMATALFQKRSVAAKKAWSTRRSMAK